MVRQRILSAVCLAALSTIARPQSATPLSVADSPRVAGRAPVAIPSGSPRPNPQSQRDPTRKVADATLAGQIAELLVQPEVARDHWGIQVTTLEGTPIYSFNEGQLFQPASNAKLFTTAASLALLGPDKTFNTTVQGTLDPATGTVTGEIFLVGHGDAGLSARHFPYSSSAPQGRPRPDPLRYLADLADQLAQQGVKTITGDVVGDDTYFTWEPYPNDWSIDDVVWGYAAPVSALTVADNQILLTVRPGAITGPEGSKIYHNAAATLDQNGVPYYTVESHVDVAATHASNGIQIERAPGSKTLRVYGQISEDAAPDVEEIAIADPAEYAAMAFKQALEARGITVEGTARARHQLPEDPFGFLTSLHADDRCEQLVITGGQCPGDCFVSPAPGAVLASHLSPTLAQDVILTNKISQNLHAELMLRQLGKRVICGEGTAVEGARMVRAFLINAGIDPNDFVFFDGSGLSGHDLVTPRATAKLLQFATTRPWFAGWKASLPVGGVDGSLETRFAKAPLKGHVFAKTGTLGEARALSGYLDCASGRAVIFSILVGNHLPGDSSDREAMDKIVAAIAATQ